MISALVLAAGLSKRMGEKKMVMPWGETTVIGKVVSTLKEAGVKDIYLVMGGIQSELKDALKEYRIYYLYNKEFEDGEMLTSVKVGLKGMGTEMEAALIVLGDQPQIELQIVRKIVERYRSTLHMLIVPSYKMHRGHPWLVTRSLWNEILALQPPETLRDFLNSHANDIDYVSVENRSVIQDLDTPADYSSFKP